jgi:hypothetical protein
MLLMAMDYAKIGKGHFFAQIKQQKSLATGDSGLLSTTT